MMSFNGTVRNNSGVVISDIQDLPQLDALLRFSKPNIVGAGLVLCGSRILLFHTFDGIPKMGCADASMFKTPCDALLDLFDGFGIECGRQSDGNDLGGKIVDLTEPSLGVPINKVYPDLKVNDDKVLTTYRDILAMVWEFYPDNTWDLI